MSNLAEILGHLGLSDWESRALATLLMSNDLPASEVALRSSIPPSKIYNVLSALQDKSLLSIIRTKPNLFRPREKEQIAKLLQERVTRRAEETIGAMAQALAELNQWKTPTTPTTSPGLELFSVRGPFHSERQARKRDVQNEFLSYSGDASWVSHDAELLENLVKRGVDVRILAPSGTADPKSIEIACKFGVKVRYSEVPFHGEIVDGKSVHVIHLERNHFNPARHHYQTLTIYHPGVVKGIRDHYQSLWQAAKRV